MRRKIGLVLIVLLVIGAILGVYLLLRGHDVAVLNPKGTIGHSERNLFVFTVLLGLVVIIPVFIMATVIALKYREGNTKAKYTPDWDTHRIAEITWWGIPIVIIGILSVVAWVSTHQLDPYKPLTSDNKPVVIQVVALDWKWLFIYPDQNIATVNFVQFPVNTPVDFEITSDAPMNSFWIPSLGGQIYAMPGMSTHQHLMASQNGDYAGSSANISGDGFAGMKFIARASSSAAFEQWLHTVRQSPKQLTSQEYDELAKPSHNNKPAYYSASTSGLYDTIVMKYMMPGTTTNPEVVTE